MDLFIGPSSLEGLGSGRKTKETVSDTSTFSFLLVTRVLFYFHFIFRIKSMMIKFYCIESIHFVHIYKPMVQTSIII